MTTDLHLEQSLKMSGFMPPTPICGQGMHWDYFPYEQYKILFQKLCWFIMIFSYFCKKKIYYEFVVARFEVLGEVLLEIEDF